MSAAPTRLETDGLGQRELPAEALYGINTLRALDNFPLSGRTIGSLPEFVAAIPMVKQAAARANAQAGLWPPTQHSRLRRSRR